MLNIMKNKRMEFYQNKYWCMCGVAGVAGAGRGVRGEGRGTPDNSAHGLMSILWMGGRRPRAAVGAAINFIYSYAGM